MLFDEQRQGAGAKIVDLARPEHGRPKLIQANHRRARRPKPWRKFCGWQIDFAPRLYRD
jgi:hypothetical protein